MITGPQKRRRRSMSEINVVPYIDVMLVLLVIFMITAPLLTQGVTVSLPRAQAKSLHDEHNTPIIVSVNRKGHYFINIAEQPQKSLTAQQLLIRMAAEHQLAPQRPVLVKGDRAVAYDAVVQLMVLLQRAGIKRLGMLTTPSPS